MRSSKIKKRKKRGITLVELLVAMACGSIVLTMLLSTMVFISKTSDGVIVKSEDALLADAVERRIRALGLTDIPTVKTEYDGTIGEGQFGFFGGRLKYYKDNILTDIASEDDLSEISFAPSEDGRMIKCTLKYKNRELCFTAGRIIEDAGNDKE